MSFFPAFKVGLWNGWILIVPFLLIFFFGQIVNKDKFKQHPLTKKEKKLTVILQVILLISFIYPIFLPLNPGIACFYIGVIIYVVGLVFGIAAEINFSTTPRDMPVTKGIYRISRNPMFFGGFLIFVGIGIAGISWVYLAMAVAFIILNNSTVIAEERFCLEEYGNVYREYMNKTPKWIGIPHK
jgi:protein-S-isoprenylcysteine O-methyltransferase Ste14